MTFGFVMHQQAFNIGIFYKKIITFLFGRYLRVLFIVYFIKQIHKPCLHNFTDL